MNKLKLLIVDDIEMERALVIQSMSEQFDVVTAEDGLTAWNILNSQKIDIVLLDIVMPVMDGLELLARIKEESKLSDVGILVAASMKEQAERSALEIGADDVVSKPYDYWVLKARINNIVAKKQMQKAAKRAEEANNAKNVFMSNMSHDMRTPLNAIINLTSIARDEIDMPELLINDLDKISVSGEFLLGLVNDVLDMAKIENGTVELSPGVYPFQEFSDYIDSVIKPLCSKKDMEFQWEQDGSCYDLYIDRIRFNQIFFNLLSNAIKYTPVGGKVGLRIHDSVTSSGYLTTQITVTDNGKGMSHEFQKKLFVPFEREDNSEAYAGTGLGLSITKAIVDKMGGTIHVESEPGEGTVVTVTLTMPIATKEQSEEYHRNHQKPAEKHSNSEILQIAKGKRILIVEDHPLNREIICRLLEKTGAAVDTAEDGSIALERIKTYGADYYNMIFMDIRMPVLDGLQATREIRKMKHCGKQELPIVAMTANAYAEDIKKSVQAGMNEHLSKPIEPKKMYEVLCKYITGQNRRVRPKVLVVDDIEVNSAVVSESLNEDYTPITASNGVEALELLAQNEDIVAVITDIQMPKMNGIELVRRIREVSRYDKIAILANTQYGDPAQEEVLLKNGADDFVYKPTTPTVLSTRLENVLFKHRQFL